MSFRIGNAGWSIPARIRGSFGEAANGLARYARRLDTVEINSSFYRPHSRDTYAKWAAAVPRSFRFAVKAPQRITHELALAGTRADLDAFLAQVAGLGAKLGCILVQLPPSVVFAPARARAFFALLRTRHEGPVACEPRHASWFEDRADALLARHGIARVAADPARVPAAAEPGGDLSFRYWRWHGSPRMYWSDYEPERLAALAASMRRGGGQRWCIFDNTAWGHSVENALSLAALLRRKRKA
jgi:uncharacterized protein YecE (DUF72 family)